MDVPCFKGFTLCFCIFLWSYQAFTTDAKIVELTLSEQIQVLEEKKEACVAKMMADPTPDYLGDTFCPRTWDGVSCFEDTAPGETIYLACPDFVHGFDTEGQAYRKCGENGTWLGRREPRTNYLGCFMLSVEQTETYGPPTPLLEKHIKPLQIMYNLGYALSCVLLLIALSIMLGFRNLHCPRNYIHMNLFISFILRAVFSLLKDNLMKDGLGFPADVEKHPDMQELYIFKEEGEHWQCKLFFTLFNYVLLLNYTWIFLEGLYLHNLIFVRVMSEQTPVRWYCAAAWVAPLVPIIPWVAVRIYLDDHLCWNVSKTEVHWIVRGPIIALIAVNLFLFINVLRVLFTKLNSPIASTERRHKYKKLARSTLVLIPLFGVYYIVTIFFPDNIGEKAQLFQLYFELFFNSWSGALIAVLFCFLNGEVRSELKKKCKRLQQARTARHRTSRRLSKGGSSFTLMTSLSSSQRKGSATPSVVLQMLKSAKSLKSSTVQILPATPSVEHALNDLELQDNDSIGGSLPRGRRFSHSLVSHGVMPGESAEPLISRARLTRKLSLPVSRKPAEIINEDETSLPVVPTVRRGSDAFVGRTTNWKDLNHLTFV